MKKILILGAAILISGCSTTSTTSPTGEAQPINYRSTVTQHVKASFFDPYSIRDASISQPIYATALFDGVTPFPQKGWIVCVRANSKNRMGAYIGLQQTAMLFSGNTVKLTLSGPDFSGQVADLCKTAAYRPFPEIEEKR